MNPANSDLTAALQAACRDLQWISDTEAPFTVVFWQHPSFSDLTESTLLHLTRHPNNTPVECLDVDNFFDYSTRPQAWHSQADAEIAQRYQHLVETLKHWLSNLRVYRVGTIEFDIYVLGQTKSGHIAGLVTQAVET